MKLIDQKKFDKAALHENFETFVVYIATLKAPKITIYLFQTAEVASLQANQAPTIIFFKYLDFADIFLADLTMGLPKQNNMNHYIMKQVEGKQPSYWPIYSLGLVELETLKIYIEIHLKIGFIGLFKFSTEAFILFDQKLDRSFCLYVNY